jgi:hypothetical protein
MSTIFWMKYPATPLLLNKLSIRYLFVTQQANRGTRLHWINRYSYFHNKPHAEEMGEQNLMEEAYVCSDPNGTFKH